MDNAPSHLKDFIAKISNFEKDLNRLKKRPWINRKQIQAVKSQIQGAEALRDIYTTGAAYYASGGGSNTYCVNKNSTNNYDAMVETGYQMFLNYSDYGGELMGSLLTSRVAFIGGEGPTVVSDNKDVEAWANNWLKLNQLDGEKNIRFLESGELEGKHLMILSPVPNPPGWINDGKGFISVQGQSWRHIKYEVEKEKSHDKIIKSIQYKQKDSSDMVNIPIDQAVFLQLGGLSGDSKNTVYGLMRCLSHIESASRTFYDISHVSNLYGFPKPCIQIDHNNPNKNQEINEITTHYGTERPPNEMYVGTGKHYYSSPDSGATDANLEALKAALRFISLNSDLPLLMIAWPELMSNRATAQVIGDIINTKTAIPRSIWEVAYKELLYKARIMTVDNGFLPEGIDQEAFLSADIRVKMPLASYEILKQVLAVWIPLFEKSIITKDTLRNMIPGIDPAEEKRLEKKEKRNDIRDEKGLPENPGDENGREQEGPIDTDRRNQPMGG